jgi:hypothetical protein
VSKDNDKKKEQRDAYKSTSNNLQNAVLIFLAFLIFVSFVILFPYYYLADDYKNAKDTEFHGKEIHRHLESIKNTLTTYEITDHNFTNTNNRITNTSVIYNNLLTNVTSRTGNNSAFQDQARGVETYDECNTYENLTLWISCNVLSKIGDNRNTSYIIIDNSTIGTIYNSIPLMQKSISETVRKNITRDLNENLESLNNTIKNLQTNITKNKTANGTMYLSLSSYDKLFTPIRTFSLADFQIQKILKKIQNDTSKFQNRVESVQYPIIGKVPLSLGQFFLAFPTVIGVGFSFISLQLKRLISIHKELGLTENNDKAFMSWMDPLQGFPEKAYPLLIIALPGILFGVSFWFIFSIFYTNVPYPQFFSSLTTDDPLSVTNNLINDVMVLNLFILLLFVYCYCQIFKAWAEQDNLR